MVTDPALRALLVHHKLCFPVMAPMTVFETAADAQTTRLHSQMDPSAILTRVIAAKRINRDSEPEFNRYKLHPSIWLLVPDSN